MRRLQEKAPFVQHLFSAFKKLFHYAVMADDQANLRQDQPFLEFYFGIIFTEGV